MENKTIIIWAIALILIILIILGIYFFAGNNEDKKVVEKEQQPVSTNVSSLSKNVSSLSDLPNFQNNSNNAYAIMNSLDKTKCSNLSVAQEQTICINGINLIEKAIAANDTQVCFDKTINVNVMTRGVCLDKMNNLQKS